MKIKLAVALASTLFVTVAHAQTFTPGFYAGAELGYSHVNGLSDDPASQLTSAMGGTANVSQDKGVFSGRIFGGYKVAENVDLELGYFQSASYSQNVNGVAANGVAYSASGSQKVNGVDYSVLLRPSISTGFNGAFLRIGGHYSRIEQQGAFSGGGYTDAYSGHQSGSGFMAGLGYDLSLTKNVALRAEYNRMENIGGRSDSPADTVLIGVVGKF